MHEMSIAVELVRQLESLAGANGIQRVESLAVQAGAMRGIVPEALDIAFASAGEGTVAEGAKLELEIVPAVAKCRLCGCQFEPSVDSYLCAGCNQADVDIIQGNEILLTSVTGLEKNEGRDTNED